MKSRVLFCILVLCTSCVPQGLPTVEPRPALIGMQPSPASTGSATTFIPTPTITTALLLPSPTPIFEVVIDNVAIDQQGRLYASGFGASGDDLRHFAQWDGTRWVELGDGFHTAGNSLTAYSAGVYTEVFTETSQGMAAAIMRWDGAGWEDITGNFNIVVDELKAGRVSSNVPVVDLAADGKDNLYAAGMYYYPNADYTEELPMGYVAMWNKKTWTVLGQGFDRINIFELAVSAEGKVYASGEQPLTLEGNSSYIAQWGGEEWTQMDTNKLRNISLCMALDSSGRLYVSSKRSGPGEVISYWDGTGWITISDQLGGEAPAVYDMEVDAHGHLYIGGSFESVSGIPARNIAWWDGSSWHPLGDGLNAGVWALAFDPTGELYAVGFFTGAGDIPTYHVARWDGGAWHALVP